MEDIYKYLSSRPYPGRGILLGNTLSGAKVAAYFIMGRSENSRNRVFAATDDGIRTEARDPAKMTNPSLVIYNPVRLVGDNLIITNGDQTDTIRDYLSNGRSFEEALRTRSFEPDAPFFTPRISGLIERDGKLRLSILKALHAEDNCCLRYFFEYEKTPAGTGYFISTYEGGGEPLPSFTGEPRVVKIDASSASELMERLWSSLDFDNKVSLYVNIGGDTKIINKY